jgi:hypothetical protein
MPKLGLLFLGYTLAYALTLLGWWFIGHGALAGRIDRGWLWAWGLSVASLIPLRAFVNWLGFDLFFSCAALLKRRFFAGACERLINRCVAVSRGRDTSCVEMTWVSDSDSFSPDHRPGFATGAVVPSPPPPASRTNGAPAG